MAHNAPRPGPSQPGLRMHASELLPPTSTTNLLLNPLNHIQDLAHLLFLSLSPARNKPPPAPPVAAFLDADAALAAAVATARAHQARQRRIDALKAEILALEGTWRAVVEQLEEGRRELHSVIVEGEARIKAIEQAKAAAIPYPELLAYAQSLSAFTSAPPNMPDLSLPGQAPPPLFFPPFPNEEKMRRGHLSAEEPLGTLGETHSVGHAPRSPSPELQQGPNVYRPHDTRPQQIFDLDLDLNPDL